jgi:phage gp45-like
MAMDLSGLIQVGFDVLTTTVNATTKKITAQLGSVVGKTTDTDNAEWWQHYGFASRPPKPEAGKEAAQAVVVRMGDHDIVLASQDLRGLELYGALDHGETCIYAAGSDGKGQARVLLKKDGSINIYTKEGNTSGGAGVALMLRADGSVSIATPSKAALLIEADGSIKLFNSSGGIQVKADGSVKVASGGKVEISGASITMGGPTALPLAVAPHVLTAITALQVEIAAVAAALVACMNIPGPILPPHGTAAAAATSAVGVAAGLLAGLATQIPTKRTSAD